VLARPDYKYVAGELAEETWWLLGEDGRRTFEQLDACPPAQESRAFADGGYYVMRDGWTHDSNYLLLDCGPHGFLNCGHAHADALSFELAAAGRTLLVDPGTYTYTTCPTLRDAFRTATAHNTLTVDGESSSVPDGAFTWKTIAVARPLSWISHKRFDYFAGMQEGYARLASPVTHSRNVLFLKQDYWILRDHVATAGAHHYQSHFHFAADTDPVIDSELSTSAVRERTNGEPGVEILAFGKGGTWWREEGWVSSHYAARTPAPVLIFSLSGVGDEEIVTFLVPRAASAANVQVRELEAHGGRAFEVQDGAVRDIVLLGSGLPVEAARMRSDFAWTWARFGPTSDTPTELVLLGGTFLSLEGREIFRAKGRAAYVLIRWIGAEVIVETDQGKKQMAKVVSA
jgi:hypothetical protein